MEESEAIDSLDYPKAFRPAPPPQPCPGYIMLPYQKSRSPTSKQSTFNFTHFLGFFGAYTYVEETKQKKRTQAICCKHENYNQVC